MDIKDRLKKIRNILHITQQEFADRLGIKRNTVATYEAGKSNPSDSAIVLICREFDVREEWLRTGEGEMFKPKPSDILDRLAHKYQFSNADYVIAKKFVSLNPNKRREIVENVFSVLHEIETALTGMDPYAPAHAGNEPAASQESAEKDRNHMTVEEAEAEYIKSRLKHVQKEKSSVSNSTAEKRIVNQ